MTDRLPPSQQEPIVLNSDARSRRRPYLNLLLISFAILFLELACIRWFGSMVIFLTFFTNIVLTACFLGMSVGCMVASSKRNYIKMTIPVTLLAVVLSIGTQLIRSRFAEIVSIDVGRQRSPQEVFFGTAPPKGNLTQFVIPIEAYAGLFFVLIALMFVGLGQEMGRKFNEIPGRVGAYTANIFGSLLGIVAFGAASYFRTSPLLWFAVVVAICFFFLPKLSIPQVVCQIVLLVLVGAMSSFAGMRAEKWSKVIWSPYYRVTYNPLTRSIDTNNIGHQGMRAYDDELSSGYALPHLLNRDAGNPAFEDVLIVGAGSGNDVSAALVNGAKHIDAVDIEPVLNEIGRENHPDRPYSDPRVSIHLEDGRSFVRKTPKRYDLIAYALVDSLVLHSGYSSLRLESFLFTEEAFRDIEAKLKPDGLFVMYNYYRQGWIVGRLEKMAEQVFGTKPVVISLPYQEKIVANPSDQQSDASDQTGHITFIVAGRKESAALEAIKKKFAASGTFWINNHAGKNANVDGYGPQPPNVASTSADDWERIAPATVDTAGIDFLPNDNWPFLYLRSPRIPSLNIRGMIMIAVLSLIILCAFAPVRTLRPNGQMFFLGAGFMLLETKGVVHMALLFGSTWVVNSIVFFAILVMILLSNLTVLFIKPKRQTVFYSLLIASLLVNAYVPMTYFLSLPGEARVVFSCLVVFLPVFFAGVIFAASFRDSQHPDVDFGSNIGGVILGGMAEFFSLVVGFDHLLYIAIGFYVLSAILAPRRPVLAGG
jgi:SAM-dependent methyltransferase